MKPLPITNHSSIAHNHPELSSNTERCGSDEKDHEIDRDEYFPGKSPQDPHAMVFDQEQLSVATSKAAKITNELRRDYPILKPYLVLTVNGDYVNANSTLETILHDVPAIMHDNPAKAEILRHFQETPPERLRTKNKEKRLAQWKNAWNMKFVNLSHGVRFRSDALFEIRFDNLIYEEVWRMQKDERVDAFRTPQTKASIRIILGTVAHYV